MNAEGVVQQYLGKGLGLNPGEIVAVPSELPDPENWEVLDEGEWVRLGPHPGADWRCICRPVNKEAGE